ncbi:S8 family peptidase [Nocardia rhizosphaerihabitans]|uniref:S8 family peptidase n=1 Tax=Nocardia rhizosphaerihabitans TaxID=1691570 RepID=UPI00366AC1B9
MAGPRFLIGFGERLTAPIAPGRGGGSPQPPYTVAQARVRLAPMVRAASESAVALPKVACPDDETVTAVTLHPQYVSKNGYPTRLLASMEFDPLGSRPVTVVPDGDAPRPSTLLFLATTRANLRLLATRICAETPLRGAEHGIVSLAEFRLNSPADRLRLTAAQLDSETVAELVLHSGRDIALQGLLDFSRDLDLDVAIDRRLDNGGLAFVPVTGTHAAVAELARYSFTRVIRRMPRMRTQLGRDTRSTATLSLFRPELPTAEPTDRELTVAVFDGGLPARTPLTRWVDAHTFADSAAPHRNYLDHGHRVTSALLFGSVDPAHPVPVPYGYIDHYQVLDEDTDDDQCELYAAIDRIDSVLRQRKYEFVNVSIGPELPIEDDEVHAWTAFWDDYLSDGTTLATIAVGNNGEADRPSGNARVQVPADSVNALAIGSSDRSGALWNRAPYSAIGPGRSPGTVKPDLLAFGGSDDEPFHVVGPDGTAIPDSGTSFAAPMAMRAALGARTLFGPKLGALDLKALLVHTAERRGSSPDSDSGHGRIAATLAEMVLCGDGEARVLYQGELTPAKYLRAQIPLPAALPAGMVRIRATLVYATPVDPADPGSYTRSGLDVTFRPHDEKFAEPTRIHPDSAPFFRATDLDAESVLRRTAHKWDTVLHAERSKRVNSLRNPVFDIHHTARRSSHVTTAAQPIRYSMVITVRHAKVDDLYERVLSAYVTQLEALRPTVDIPLDV